MPEDAYLTKDEFLAYKEVAEKELKVLRLQNKNEEYRKGMVVSRAFGGVAILSAVGLAGIMYSIMYESGRFEETTKEWLVGGLGAGSMGIALLGIISTYWYSAMKSRSDNCSQKIGNLEQELENARAQPAYRSLTTITQE